MSGIAGDLRERIVRLEPGPRDAAGAAGADVEAGTAWAAIRPERASVGPAGETLRTRRRWRLRMRPEAALSVGDRCRWGGRTLVVVARTDDPARPDVAELVAEERP